MKQIIIFSIALASVLASYEQHHQYAPQHLSLIDLGEHLDLKHTEFKHEYPAGLLFGHGYISGLEHHSNEDSLKGYGSGPGDYTISSNIASAFEENLVSAELPKIVPQIKTSIAPAYNVPTQEKFVPRYTKTLTSTYEVNENTYDPVPIPKISIPRAILPKQNPVQIGSGSLGVVDLGQGKYALGSGTLGYGQSQAPASGGLEVIPAPQFKTSETYAAKSAPIEQGYQDLGSFEDADFNSYFKS